MFENAFLYDPKGGEHPVRFGFSEEERAYLKKERTAGEIASYVNERGLAGIVFACIFYNDTGFMWLPVRGSYREKDGEVFFDAKDYGRSVRLDAAAGTDEGRRLLENKYTHHALVPGSKGLSVISVSDKDAGPDDCSYILMRASVQEFLAYSGVNTYHKLGKLINRCCRIRTEREGAGPYPGYAARLFGWPFPQKREDGGMVF